MANQQDYVEIGLDCADICTALDRGMNGKRVDDLSQSVCKAISQLTVWVKPATRFLWLADDVPDHARAASDIQKKAIEQKGRNYASRLIHAKGDKDKIVAWKLELDRILQVFNVRSLASTSSSLIVPFSDRTGFEH